MTEYLVESDFLFGLRPSDLHYMRVQKLLDLVKIKKVTLKVTNSAYFEVRTVCYSQGKNPAEVAKILILMKIKLEEHNIGEVPLTIDDFILSEHLRVRHKELTFFDSLHVAVSKRQNIKLLANDKVLKKLNFIEKTFKDDF